MTRIRRRWAVLVVLGVAVACDGSAEGGEPVAPSARGAGAQADGSRDGDDARDGPGQREIAIRDDCDPRDPGWAPTGGCTLRRGDVTVAEFDEELDSPLAAAVVGHQAWRNDPPYLETETGRRIRVRNEGGRAHTFTRVAEFGGGRVPPLNEGLTPAPECATAATIAPGGRAEASGLIVGVNRFQCCIHPWMRALITVEPRESRSGG